MRLLLLILLPYGALFLQTTLFNYYSLQGTIPDMVMIFVVFYALLNKERKAVGYGFLCGLLEDLYIGGYWGMNALAKGLTAWILSRLQGNVFKENLLVGILSVLAGTVINSLALLLLNLTAVSGFHINISIFTSLFYQLIYNGMLSLPLYLWYYNSSKNGLLTAPREN